MHNEVWGCAETLPKKLIGDTKIIGKKRIK